MASHFRIPSSGHLRPLVNRKILELALLVLRFCSILAAKFGPNLGANSVKSFFARLPLAVSVPSSNAFSAVLGPRPALTRSAGPLNGPFNSGAASAGDRVAAR